MHPCWRATVMAESASWCSTAGSGPQKVSSMGYRMNMRLYGLNFRKASGYLAEKCCCRESMERDSTWADSKSMMSSP